MQRNYNGAKWLEPFIVAIIVSLLAVIVIPWVASAREAGARNTNFAVFHAASLGSSMYSEDYDPQDDVRPQQVHITANNAHTTTAPITYHGGPVMVGMPHVYPIYYGTWTAEQMNIINGFLGSVGGTSYYNINSTYYSGTTTRSYVQNSLGLGLSASVSSATYGLNLTDANIASIVETAIVVGLPLDSNGLYLVLTSGGIKEKTGFCSSYCGWHSYATYNNVVIKYGFVGDPTACLSACAWQAKESPNGDVGVDAMISVIAHEVSEAVTDPELNAWYDKNGNEMADKCAWTFGTTKKLPGGALYNVTFSGVDYLIQQLWVNPPNGAGSCTLHSP